MISTFRAVAIGGLTLLGLTACAATGGTPAASSAGQGAMIGRATEGPDLGAINGFGIPSGRCGMVLYAQSGAKPVPIFRSTDDGLAMVQVDGALRQIVLVGRGGETQQGIPSSQFFRTDQSAPGGALSVAIQTRWGTPFPSGAYVQDGTLTVTAADGWSRVVPVAGIAGCKP